VANVVAAACLCHDIRNPPFGHNGETAIQKWFTLNVKEKQNLYGK
jgi:dGTPase